VENIGLRDVVKKIWRWKGMLRIGSFDMFSTPALLISVKFTYYKFKEGRVKGPK